MKFICDCLESVFRQSVWHKMSETIKISVNLVDNGSQDGTVDFVRKNYPAVHILKNINNLGFCRAHNQAIRLTEADWYLILNTDIILEKDFLEKVLLVAEKCEPSVGCFGGKLLKAKTIWESGGLPKVIKTDKIDACGLLIKKSRQVKNIGENEIDRGQYDGQSEVFGFSGACLFLRKEALESIKFKEEYFDEDFFAYQEDFDLAYRLQLAGWRSGFVAGAKAYHFRAADLGTLNPFKVGKIIQARRAKSELINYYSYKNHWLVLLKNEIAVNFWRHSPFIFWFELKKFIFLLFFETRTLKSLVDFFHLLPKMKLKRKIIMEGRKASAKEIRRWFI